MALFRSGNTTNIFMELSKALDGKKLKVGIYTESGKPLYETTSDDPSFRQVDEIHYKFTIHWSITKHFIGNTTLRVVVFNDDKTFVNAGENHMDITWLPEPATRVLPKAILPHA